MTFESDELLLAQFGGEVKRLMREWAQTTMPYEITMNYKKAGFSPAQALLLACTSAQAWFMVAVAMQKHRIEDHGGLAFGETLDTLGLIRALENIDLGGETEEE